MAIVLINETPTEVGCGADEIIRLREELAAAQDDVVAWKYEADGFRRNRDALSAELIASNKTIWNAALEHAAAYIEQQGLPDMYSEPCLKEFAEAIRKEKTE